MKRSIFEFLSVAKRPFYALYRHLEWKIQGGNRFFVHLTNGCRLGNQLFFVSFGEMLRTRYGFPVCYYTPVKRDYLRTVDALIFKKFKVLTFNIRFVKTIREKEWDPQLSPIEIASLLKEGNVLIEGVFEDIHKIDVDLSRKLFSPSTEWVDKVTAIYGDLKDYVCLHVRRGDFVKLGITSPLEYYYAALERFPSRTRVIVVSDDIEWCKEHIWIDDGFSVIYADRHKQCWDSMYYDFFIPTLCRRGNIISCSTFTWWGSVLNLSYPTRCVAPYPWWGYMKNKALYLPHMIRLTKEGEEAEV